MVYNARLTEQIFGGGFCAALCTKGDSGNLSGAAFCYVFLACVSYTGSARSRNLLTDSTIFLVLSENSSRCFIITIAVFRSIASSDSPILSISPFKINLAFRAVSTHSNS